jgi:prepilin-type N-terminal cleavage/methylation domain-containing protein
MKKGFTLVELLVVIAIIGILSAVAVVSLGGIREKGRDARRLSDMDALKQAMELYKNENVGYPVCSTGAISGCSFLNMYLPAITTMKDPSGVATPCTAVPTGVCNYSIITSTAADFSISFFMETGAGNVPKGARTLTPMGIK